MSEPTTSSASPEKTSWLLNGLVGLLIGAALTSGVFLILMRRQEARHQEQLAALRPKSIDLVNMLNSALGNSTDKAPQTAAATPADAEAAKVLAFGKAFVADLENDRLASAYRTTTATYQAKQQRKEFDEMVHKIVGVRRLIQQESDRESKVRKQADGTGHEFYFTGHDYQASGQNNRINLALVIVPEKDGFRVSELELTAEKGP